MEDQSIDEDDDFEYGDAASHDRLADPSDYSEHQFIAGDDARGVKAMNDAGDADGDDGASHVDDDGRVTWQRGEARVRESAREVCAHRRVGEGFERASRTVRGGRVAKLAVAIVAPALE